MPSDAGDRPVSGHSKLFSADENPVAFVNGSEIRRLSVPLQIAQERAFQGALQQHKLWPLVFYSTPQEESSQNDRALNFISQIENPRRPGIDLPSSQSKEMKHGEMWSGPAVEQREQ